MILLVNGVTYRTEMQLTRVSAERWEAVTRVYDLGGVRIGEALHLRWYWRQRNEQA